MGETPSCLCPKPRRGCPKKLCLKTEVTCSKTTHPKPLMASLKESLYLRPPDRELITQPASSGLHCQWHLLSHLRKPTPRSLRSDRRHPGMVRFLSVTTPGISCWLHLKTPPLAGSSQLLIPPEQSVFKKPHVLSDKTVAKTVISSVPCLPSIALQTPAPSTLSRDEPSEAISI